MFGPFGFFRRHVAAIYEQGHSATDTKFFIWSDIEAISKSEPNSGKLTHIILDPIHCSVPNFMQIE